MARSSVETPLTDSTTVRFLAATPGSRDAARLRDSAKARNAARNTPIRDVQQTSAFMFSGA